MSRKTLSSVSILMLAGSYVSLASAEAPNGISITPSTITKWADGFGDLTNSVIYEDPNTGQVGIGTSTPDGNLTVEGGTVTVNGNRPIFNGTGIQLFNRASGNTNKWVLGTGGAFVAPDGFSIGDTSAYRFVILGNGNVGINTIAPTARLDVNNEAGGTGLHSTGSNGVYGFSSGLNGNGVIGEANVGSNAYGVWGISNSGYAGFFTGRVTVAGRFDSPDKHFKIDHPLDPANKYMVHASVESAERMNIYNGMVTLDGSGEATVTLPEWFEALNRDFRYQLTSVGSFAPVYIAEEVSDNQFKIAGGNPGGKVSWQVTGVRHDAYANANPMQVEEAKPDSEKGYYMHPGLFGQPEEKGIEWAHHPEMMRQMKAAQQK